MSEIKRWDATGPDERMESNSHGMFVLHSDHEAEVARLRAELADAHAAIESKAGWEWKKEADRLRAEVEGLRSACQRLVRSLEDTYELSDDYSDDRIYDELPSSSIATAYLNARDSAIQG